MGSLRLVLADHPSISYTSAPWRRLRLEALERDNWTCRMCGCLLRQGKTGPDSAAVDHLYPVRLRPDLFLELDAIRSVCRSCHSVCDSIEKRLGDDAEAIAAAKLAYRPIGLDGYPVEVV